MRPTNKYERLILARTKTRAPKERMPLYDKWVERRVRDDMTARFDDWQLDNLTAQSDRPNKETT